MKNSPSLSAPALGRGQQSARARSSGDVSRSVGLALVVARRNDSFPLCGVEEGGDSKRQARTFAGIRVA